MPYNDAPPAPGTNPWYTPLIVNWIGGLIVFVNTLETLIGQKAPIVHTHAAADITSGTLALARIPALPASQVSSGVLDIARIPDIGQGKVEGLTAALGEKADLVDGFIPTSQIPAVAFSTFLGPTASQAAMLALVGQENDYTIRTDLGAYAVLTAQPASNLANWFIFPFGGASSGVMSVNGDAGPIVVLDAADVGARSTSWVPAWTDVTDKPTTFPPTIGATATTAVAGNDARLTDERVPTPNSVDNTKVADGALSIAKTNGLQEELDGKVEALSAGAAVWIGPQATFDGMTDPRPAGVYFTS